jgi:class 3 adenylate cyclase
MTVVVFSKSPNSPRMKFPRRPRTGPEVEVQAITRMRRALPSLGRGQLVYLDMAGLGEVERRRALAALMKMPCLHVGVIDPQGKVSDVAGLFHAGAVDYIGKEFRRTGLTARRLERVMAFAAARGLTAPATGAPAGAAAAQGPEALDGVQAAGLDGWGTVVPGQEHAFAFLFVEVDGVEAMKRRSGADNLSRAMETFRAFIERKVNRHGGRLWTWAGFGGLALFPLGGRAVAAEGEQNRACSPVLCMLRIALGRLFYDVEESPLPARLSFRMALSTGSLVYREKDTGGVIAESLNAIFHLGQKFARAGCCVLTEDALAVVPERLRGMCLPAGTFEGRRIFRLAAPPYPAFPREFPREGEWPSAD